MNTPQSVTLPIACTDHAANLREFTDARLGLFIHYGLYSILGRGEWVLNRERIPLDEYRALAKRFDPSAFDADAIARLARDAGCRYVCFTTMHHDGFALYDSKVNPFNSVNACGRDLTAEVIAACRRHGLRVHLYHSLNHWTCKPDGVDALENAADRKAFVDFAFDRIRELVTLYNPVECLWYDGWWPFHADGWRSKEMNAMVRAIQPHILLNGRNGLAGDFATPEQHITAPRPWRPWEACVTHNTSWGYHTGDHRFKPTWQVVDMVIQVAMGAGNLLINVGPDGSGTIPEPSVRMLRELGAYLHRNGEAIYGSEPFTFDYQTRGNHRSDWSHNARFTARGNTIYANCVRWPGTVLPIAGLERGNVVKARLLGDDRTLKVTQRDGRVIIEGLPANPPLPEGGVVALDCDQLPSLYLCGGMRIPSVKHPPYDPCESDLQD